MDHSKGTCRHNYNEWCMFHKGKLDLNKIQIYKRRLLSYLKILKLGLGWLGYEHSNMGLIPDTIQGPTLPKTRDATPCHCPIEWSTRLLELGPEPNESFSPLAYQHIKECFDGEGDMVVSVKGGRVNLNRTRGLSWWWLITWRSVWLVCIHFDDVLITHPHKSSLGLCGSNKRWEWHWREKIEK